MTSQRILIVDDIPVNLKLLRALLEAEGYTVVSALNGVEALAVLKREPIDVIISDILMPEMDGYRLCFEVRSSKQFEQTPFIFYTSTYVSPADEKLSMEMGADHYLRKPAPAADLLRAIEVAQSVKHRRPVASIDGKDVLREYSERLVSKLEQKNIELSASASLLNLRTTALETAADAILITDDNGTIVWVNHAFTTTTGYSAEEAIGKTPRILKSGKHDAAFYRGFWSTIKSGRVWRGEFTNRCKDGSIRYGEHTVSPVRGPDGEITHFVGVLHDVTDRRKAEDELRETHAQLRQLLDHSPAVIYALTVDGENIVPHIVSENVTRLLGCPVSDTLSYEWWYQTLHPEDRELATASVAQTLVEGVGCCEYRMRHVDGTYRWVEDNRRLIRNSRGEPSEVVGVWTDLTERRHAQDELRMSERRFSDMLRNLHLVSMMLDRDGRVTYCNDHLLQLTGRKNEEVLGQSWIDMFLPADQQPEMKSVFLALLADVPETWHHENQIITRSGQRRLIHWNNSVLRSASGEVIGTASIGEDITDRKSLENQLLRAQRLESLGTLAGGIAHDLNNLFMPILMGVALIKRFEPGEASRKAIANIERCVKRGTDLVKQVLLFARGVDGARIAVDAASIVAELEAITRGTFPKNVTLSTSIARNLPPLSGDPTQLTQVLLNLCVNARDAMPEGGTITVSAGSVGIDPQYAVAHGGTSGGRFVVLEVSDTGSGMPPEVIDRIFEPFFTTKNVGQGTGLGLSTTLGIVRSHGGFLTVSSEVGRGSAFKVYFPADFESLSAGASVTSRSEEIHQGAGELILVVDDEQTIRDITRQTLETFGYEVLTAEDGAQAIDVYVRERSRIALILTDMLMPIIDGATLISALRRINPGVRVIAMSGVSGEVEVTRATKAGTPYFLAKPFTVELLLETVFEALQVRPSVTTS